MRRVWGQCHRREHGKKLFSRFKEDRFEISDTPRPGRLSGFDEDPLNTLIHNGLRQCRPTRELAKLRNCDHSTTVRHLRSMGKVQKSVAWFPHTQAKTTRISGWPFVHLCLLVTDWLVNSIDHSYPVSLLVTRNGVFMLT